MEACHILLGRPWQFDKKTMHNGFTNEITFTHKEKKFILYPLPPSQVVKDQEEKKLIKIENQEKGLKEKEVWEKVFLPTRSFRKKKSLKTKLKRYFFLNNPQTSCLVKEHIENFVYKRGKT